jgi:hypothetical protein
MIKAQQEMLERQRLEDSCFVANGVDTSGCEFLEFYCIQSVLMNP